MVIEISPCGRWQMDPAQATSNPELHHKILTPWYASCCKGLWVMEEQGFLPFQQNLPKLLHEHLALLPALHWEWQETAFPSGNLICSFILILFQCWPPCAYQRRKETWGEEAGCPQTIVKYLCSLWLALPCLHLSILLCNSILYVKSSLTSWTQGMFSSLNLIMFRISLGFHLLLPVDIFLTSFLSFICSFNSSVVRMRWYCQKKMMGLRRRLPWKPLRFWWWRMMAYLLERTWNSKDTWTF